MGGGAEVSTTVRTGLKGAPRGPLPPAPSPRPTLPVVQTLRQATSTWAGREGGGRLGCALRLARTFFLSSLCPEHGEQSPAQGPQPLPTAQTNNRRNRRCPHEAHPGTQGGPVNAPGV